MKIVWLSVAPWAPTGYGQQTSVFAPRIRDAGHEIAISAQNGLQFAEMDWNGIRVYPCDYTRLNKRMLRHHVADFAGDEPVQVISLFDIWPWIDASGPYGGMVADFDGLNIAAWLPVDSEPVNPKTRYALDTYNVKPIAMSKFGERVLREAGYDPLYVPHGIETDIYRPADDRAACREAMGIPADKFVIGMVANNSGVAPPRKAFPQVLQAFAVFRQTHPDAFLYLHTEVTGVEDGLNLLALAAVFGIPEDSIAAVPQVPYMGGRITKAQMSRIYSAMDVLANPSYAEGFGIPIVEAQACGTPVIVTDFTSMPELAGAGWVVGGQPWYNPSAGAMWMVPSTAEILGAFEAAYEERGNEQLRAQAREFALGYDADRVMAEYWTPALEQLGRPREVAPLALPNRSLRRAAKRAGVVA